MIHQILDSLSTLFVIGVLLAMIIVGTIPRKK